MKLFATLFATFCLAASAFGVTSSTVSSVQKSVTKKPALVSSLRKGTAVSSPLFRNPLVTRGGAVPGWDAYTKALDKNPLTAKAFTSLVGWALGDALAQVSPLALHTLKNDFTGQKLTYFHFLFCIERSCWSKGPSIGPDGYLSRPSASYTMDPPATSFTIGLTPK